MKKNKYLSKSMSKKSKRLEEQNSPSKESDVEKSSKKNKSRKRFSGVNDKLWVNVNAQEEKKKQKIAKKARISEVYSNELVPKKSAAKGSVAKKSVAKKPVENKSDAQIGKGNKRSKNAESNEAFELDSDTKNILEIDEYEEQRLQNLQNALIQSVHEQNVIIDSITSIIHSAEEENRKKKEKINMKRKAKRLLRQACVKNIDKCVEKSDDYPSDVPFVMQEHALYQEIIEHGLGVANHVQVLFVGLESLHGLSPIWLRRLLLAAQYHDIGIIDGETSHHKHSYTRIQSGFEIGISDEDREMVALLARYHRKALPSTKHEEFARLKVNEQEELCKAASILRIADALDYSHERMIKQIDLYIDSSSVTLVCHSLKEISKEIEMVTKKGNLFVRTFQKEIICKQK